MTTCERINHCFCVERVGKGIVCCRCDEPLVPGLVAQTSGVDRRIAG